MTRKEFIARAIQQQEGISKEYYYFSWDHWDSEVKKIQTFLIGDIHQVDGGSKHPMGHFSHKKVLFRDENDKEIERFFGWSANVNVNVRVHEYYKISGEVQGETVMMKLINGFKNCDPDPIYKEEDIYHEGYFTSRYLATDRMLNRFWEDNKDWLKDIQVPSRFVF